MSFATPSAPARWIVYMGICFRWLCVILLLANIADQDYTHWVPWDISEFTSTALFFVILPAVVLTAIEILGLFVLGCIIVIGKIVIMPLLMSFFISIMLMPVYRFFRNRKLPEGLAVFLPIFFIIIVVALIVWLFYSQTSFLLHDYPKIEKNLTIHLDWMIVSLHLDVLVRFVVIRDVS